MIRKSAAVLGFILAGSLSAYALGGIAERAAEPAGGTTVALAAAQAAAASLSMAPEAAPATVAAATAPAACFGQTWPYVARECLVSAEGTPVRKAVRTIGTR